MLSEVANKPTDETNLLPICNKLNFQADTLLFQLSSSS